MSSQAAPKQTKQHGALKSRKIFVSQIDTSHLTEPNCTKTFASSQPPTCNNALRQNNTSPLNRLQQNVRSVRHLTNQFRTEHSQSPTKIKSTRALSSQQPNESCKENALRINLSKVEQKVKSNIPTSPSSREKVKKKKRATTAKTLEISAMMHDPRIGSFDMGLSPHTKVKSHHQKHEKIMNLLQSYVPPSARSKKSSHQTQSVAFTNSAALDLTGEFQHMSISHLRKPSSIQDTTWENISKPVMSQTVLDQYGCNLSVFEKEEIKEYQEIYFLGNYQNKSMTQEFDDERGDYTIVPGEHIKYQYEIIEILGKGSFGQVVKVFDHKTKEYLALKIIRNHKKFQAQAKIEIKLLEYITSNKGAEYNIVELKQHFIWRQHVCILFDLMSLNLYDFLKKNKFQGLNMSLLRNITIQMLYSLKFLNHHKIIHCDIKPENILFRYPNKTGVRLIDFGSSCFEDEKLYTYIQSRFYRSPEIILGLNYNTQVDMWSLGCLLCELYSGTPIFAGDSEHDQLCAIMEVLGVPDPQLLNKASRKKLYFEENCKPKLITNSRGRTRIPASIPLSSFINGDKKFLDFIQQCLLYDPKKRYTPDDALAHPWIQEEFPQEAKSQHIKLIEKIGEKYPGDLLESKFVLDLRPLKEKEVSATTQDSKQTRRSSQTKCLEESSLNLFQIETLQREFSCGSMDLSAIKSTTNENKLKSKTTKKELKHNHNHSSFVINTSISLNRSAQNTLRSKANKSKDNLLSMLAPQSAKENLKITSRNEVLAVKENDQNKMVEKTNKAALSVKNTDRQSNVALTCINLKENVIVKEKIAKENKVKDDENVIGKVNLNDPKNKATRRNWNSTKTIDIDTKSPIDFNRNGTLKSPKNVICLSLKSPKLRKMV